MMLLSSFCKVNSDARALKGLKNDNQFPDGAGPLASRRIRALSEQRMPLQEFVERWLAAIEKRRLMRLTKGLWPR